MSGASVNFQDECHHNQESLVAAPLDWSHCVKTNPNEVQKCIRNGIPNSLWGIVWQLISGSHELRLQNPGIYSQLLSQNTSKSIEKQIAKDVPCTLKSHELFQTR